MTYHAANAFIRAAEQTPTTPAGPAGTEIVYVSMPAAGMPMHRMDPDDLAGPTGCERPTRIGATMQAAVARELHRSEPCRREGCWPLNGGEPS